MATPEAELALAKSEHITAVMQSEMYAAEYQNLLKTFAESVELMESTKQKAVKAEEKVVETKRQLVEMKNKITLINMREKIAANGKFCWTIFQHYNDEEISEELLSSKFDHYFSTFENAEKYAIYLRKGDFDSGLSFADIIDYHIVQERVNPEEWDDAFILKIDSVLPISAVETPKNLVG